MSREPTRRVLRRCPQCRLLFEAGEEATVCVVCGTAVDGLALPLEGVPSEVGEREQTIRLTPPRD